MDTDDLGIEAGRLWRASDTHVYSQESILGLARSSFVSPFSRRPLLPVLWSIPGSVATSLEQVIGEQPPMYSATDTHVPISLSFSLKDDGWRVESAMQDILGPPPQGDTITLSTLYCITQEAAISPKWYKKKILAMMDPCVAQQSVLSLLKHCDLAYTTLKWKEKNKYTTGHRLLHHVHQH